mmetsp:Transcript_3074/g.4493  ORF Transcript_3074/g.4493 Transcript_3074/m.4493 type:complete len:95 (-) Transcript_3074:17-301(-)
MWNFPGKPTDSRNLAMVSVEDEMTDSMSPPPLQIPDEHDSASLFNATTPKDEGETAEDKDNRNRHHTNTKRIRCDGIVGCVFDGIVAVSSVFNE